MTKSSHQRFLNRYRAVFELTLPNSLFRVFLPTLEKFFEEAIDQADPEAMVEDEYK